MRREEAEVLKVEIPKWLAERFRRYVAEKYGFRKGSLTRAIIDLIEKELGICKSSKSNTTIDSIVGLGLSSDYEWNGEDLVDALRRRMRHVSN